MAKVAGRGGDLEPIDRLEQKVRQLVGMVDRMKAEQAQIVDENQKLVRELEAVRGRLAASDTVANEVSSLKEERDVIRTRVEEILGQLEAINL